MTSPPPWSFSALSAFETCPKRYFHTKVAKDVFDAPGEAAVWGSTVHKNLEDHLRSGTCSPVSIQYKGLLDPILRAPGTKLVEAQLAINENLQPVEWWASDAWCRGIIDAGVLTPSENAAVLLDWKTGKRKVDSDQLKLFAGLAFSHYPKLRTVTTGFVWLKDKKIDKERFTSTDVPAIWATFIPRVQRLHRAYLNGTFLPKPSGLCRKHCPVPKSKCEFSGKT